MAPDPRVYVFAACGVLVAVALAIAAEAQVETFLHPSELETGFQERELVSGNLVYVTAFMAAVAIMVAGLVIARSGWRARLAGGGILFLASYILVAIVQTGMFNYDAVDVTRSATFTMSPIFANLDANPVIYVGPLALVAAAVLAFQSGGALLMRRAPGAVPSPLQAVRSYIGQVALATPFLLITAIGGVRLLVQMPSSQSGATPYFVVLPIAVLAAIGIVVTSSIKAWHLAAFTRNGRLAPVADEAWEAVRKAEWVLLGILIAIAVLGSMLEPIELASLHAGRVFGITARTYLQAVLAVVLVIIPLLSYHRVARAAFAAHDGHTRTLESTHVHASVIAYWVGTGIALAGAAATAWTGGALWAWAAACVPLAIIALGWLDARDALPLAMVAALVVWSIGNTISGTFRLATDEQLAFDMHPGILALFRAVAVLLVAWAVAAAARHSPAEMRQAFRVPLTIALGAVVSLIVFLELPFSAWVLREQGHEYVGLGTVVASQDAAVQNVMHVASILAATAASFIVARLHRPEWFTRRAQAIPDLPPAPSAS